MSTIKNYSEILNPYYVISQKALDKSTISDIAKEITKEYAEPQSEQKGLAYILQTALNFFMHEMRENNALQQIKDQNLSDRYVIRYLMDQDNIPEDAQATLLKKMDNHIEVVDALIEVNNPIIYSKVFSLTSFLIFYSASLISKKSAPVISNCFFLWAVGSAALGTAVGFAGSMIKSQTDYQIDPQSDYYPKSIKEKLFENLTYFSKILIDNKS